MGIKLNHIAFHVQNKTEIVDFYQNVIGFHREYQFELPAILSHTIFGIDKSLSASSGRTD